MFLTAAPAPASAPAEPPDGRRAGATWVAATGAFLLVAAAAVFIAVRWDSLPEAAKLALVGALTGGFLVGGRALRRTLPATGDVLFHLGAFLLPIDVAGLCVRAQVGWRNLVLSEGLLGVAALGSLSVATSSVVLAWSAAASVVVLAVGIAAVTPIPAPLLLAIAAAGAHLVGRRRAAISWATIAGVAPVLATGVGNALATAAGRDLGAGTLAELGLAGTTAALFAVGSGALCAAVLGREAHRSKDLGLVALAATSALCGAGTAWAAADPSDDVTFLTGPAVFVALQLAAMLAVRDAFWRRPSRALAIVGEVLAALTMPVALFWVAIAPFVEDDFGFFDDTGMQRSPVAATAFGLLATGWLLAGWRRQSPKPTVLESVRSAVADDRTVVFAFASAMAAVVLGSASTIAIAGALLVATAGLLLSRGIFATCIAVGAAAWAPVVVVSSHPALVLPAGLAAAAVLVLAGAARHRSAPAIALTATASSILVGAAAFAVDELGLTAALLAAVFASWAMALVVDRTSVVSGLVARATLLVVAAIGLAGTAGEALPVMIAATLLLLVDAVRRDDPRIAYGATLTGPLAVFTAATFAGLSAAESGVVLAGGAVVLTGLAALTTDRWRLPVLAVAAASIGAAMPLALGDPARFAETIVLAGGLVIALGLTLRQSFVAHVGGALASVGIAVHLTVDGVTATEPFVLPVALQLLVLGVQLRRREDDPPSSWIAFGPSIALLGIAALAERLDGGAAWHALVAGAVGVVAVAAGGWKRLAAPLFLGTALVVAVTVLETLHTLAGVPTWAWLAGGGTTLLLTGIALERSATSPSEVGRRLVDVVGERFE